MTKLSKNWGNLHWGNKLSVAFNFFSLIGIMVTLLAIVAGHYWNPFELGRDFEKHCIAQEVRNAQQDSINAKTIKHKDMIQLIPDAECKEVYKAYWIFKK